MVPLNDNLIESAETVCLTLEAASDYVLGAQVSASAVLTDNDSLSTEELYASDPSAAARFGLAVAPAVAFCSLIAPLKPCPALDPTRSGASFERVPDEVSSRV